MRRNKIVMGCSRKLARLRAVEGAIDIARRTPIAVDYVIPIGQQATDFSVFKKGIDGRRQWRAARAM